MKNFALQGPFYFIGVAGAGMSAIAQYLALSGETVGGSDRRFGQDAPDEDQLKLEKMNIECLAQDGSAISNQFKTVVISTAIEESNPDLIKARELGIEVLHRSDLLSAIADSKKSICFSGTSGKSTTTAMCYHILKTCGLSPSLLTGAGIQDLIAQGLIGNADVGTGEYLLMEADESDGSLVKYHPHIGVMLNLDRDHKELDELEPLFSQFRAQTKSTWIVNSGLKRTRRFSENQRNDFGSDKNCGFTISEFKSQGFISHFKVAGIEVKLPLPGLHNAENATAAMAAAYFAGVSLTDAASALETYPGIYRRMQMICVHDEIQLIDDFAHNPAKIFAAIEAGQTLSARVIGFFQPHGFAPTAFMKDELLEGLIELMRPKDSLYFSDIYYAGGTANKSIHASELAQGLEAMPGSAHYMENRLACAQDMVDKSQKGDLILLMGARDPTLEQFAQEVKMLLIAK